VRIVLGVPLEETMTSPRARGARGEKERGREDAGDLPTRPALHEAHARAPSDAAVGFRMSWIELLRLLRDPSDDPRHG